MRNWRAAVQAALMLAMFLPFCACTTSAVSALLISPMPKAHEECYTFPVRAERVDPSTMLAVMDGHVPSQLPDGFGLLGLFQQDSEQSYVEWDNASCGVVGIEMWKTSGKIPGGKVVVGAFTLTDETPPPCTSPGPKPCFQYKAQLGPNLVTIYTTGLSREEADRLVESVG